MINLWYKSCHEKDLIFDRRIITEEQSVETLTFLDEKISRRAYCFFTCFFKVLKSGNRELAQKMAGLIRPCHGSKLVGKIKNYCDKEERISSYLRTCEASLWGDLDSLKIISKEKGYFLHVPGNLHTICAHFMEHWDVEFFLRCYGYKLKKNSLFYKLAEACANNNIIHLKQHIAQWQLKKSYTLGDIILKLMLLLSIKNENILMIEHILSKCSFLSAGIMDIFEYAVDMQKCILF